MTEVVRTYTALLRGDTGEQYGCDEIDPDEAIGWIRDAIAGDELAVGTRISRNADTLTVTIFDAWDDTRRQWLFISDDLGNLERVLRDAFDPE
jgi:hypothetical protein